jgi:hypothetical protein
MMFAKTKALLLGAALIGLAACNQLGLPGTGNSSSSSTTTTTSSQTSSTSSADDAAGKKLDTYVAAHNVFVGSFGFEEKAEDYRKSDIAHASPNGMFSVDAGWIDQGVKKLQSARDMSGGSPDLNAAADALIASMGKAQTHLASLETYYESKKYLDDKLARGKAENAQMLAELDAAESDFKKFGSLLDVAIDQRDEVVLDKMKASGDLRQYNNKLALIHAKKLVDLFNGPDDVKNPALLVKGDAEVAIIEKAIADGHQEAAKQGKSDPTAFSELTSMIGEYRTFKQDHDVSDLKSMVNDYNMAIETSNMIGGLG